MRADDERRLLAVVEARERRIDAEVHRAARRLVDEPRPLLVLRRRRREPEHPASAGESPAQSVDRKRNGCRWKTRVAALSMRVRERPQQRLTRPGRSRLGWKVLRLGEPRLERGHPCPGGKTRGWRDSRPAARFRVVAAHVNPVRLVQPQRLQLRERARLDRAASGVRQRPAASKAHRRHREGRRHRRETHRSPSRPRPGTPIRGARRAPRPAAARRSVQQWS